MPGMPQLTPGVQPGQRRRSPDMSARGFDRNGPGLEVLSTVLRPALSRRETAGALIGVAGEQLLVLGHQPLRLRLPAWPGSQE